jgi:hypothetical protein
MTWLFLLRNNVDEVEGTEHVVASQGVQTGLTNRLDRQGVQEYNIYAKVLTLMRE